MTRLRDVVRRNSFIAFGFLAGACLAWATIRGSGMLDVTLETPAPADRPARRFYKLTRAGRAVALEALNLTTTKGE